MGVAVKNGPKIAGSISPFERHRYKRKSRWGNPPALAWSKWDWI